MTVRRSAAPVLFALSGIVLHACTRPEITSAPSREEQERALAAPFESPEPFSVNRLDSAALAAFLQGNDETREDSAGIMDLYRRRGFQHVWFIGDSLGSAAEGFLGLFSAVDTTLPAMHDAVPWLRTLGRLVDGTDTLPAGASARARIEMSLTARFFRLARTEFGGYVKDDLHALDWYIPRRKKDYGRLLDSLAAGITDLTPLEPVHRQYRLLREELRRIHALRDTVDWSPLVLEDTALEEHVMERLRLLGDLVPDSGGTIGDAGHTAAITRFRDRHGLPANGGIDHDFVAELNVPPADRMRTILVNMERLRWVPDETAPDLILVNIPEFRMHVFEEGSIAWSMDVVVGAEATRTVIFSDSLTTIVFAPYWNIPKSIIRNEILPAVKRDPHYLKRKNMEVVKGGEVVPASRIDWKKYHGSVPFVIRQKPGPGNALGRVKFLFPNRYSIYFHDTPAREKFSLSQRAFSHGCVRLSEPERLARYLLQGDTAWTADSLARAMNGSTELYVPLQHPRPVTMGYFTAWVDAQGRLNFRPDVYGRDARLLAELFAVEEVAEVDGVAPAAGE